MAKPLPLIKAFISSWLNPFFLAKHIFINNATLILSKTSIEKIGKTHLPTHHHTYLRTCKLWISIAEIIM